MTRPNRRSLITFTICLLLLSAGVRANLLLNPSFETGTSFPDNWIAWGDGSFVWQTGGAHTGEKCMNLGGSAFALLYQRAPAVPGRAYTASTWARRTTGGGSGTLKLEFHDAAQNPIQQLPLTFAAQSDWTEFTIAGEAPPDTALVTAAIVGEAGFTVLFDDVSIVEFGGEPDSIIFDVSRTSHTFLGFGAQIWAYGPDASFPELDVHRQQALQELNIKYVRIENFAESATWTDMQNTRAMTDALGIQWVYMIWVSPSSFMDGDGRLRDDQIDDFAAWWVLEVNDLRSHGIEVEYIELMNEPDSGGDWSTGITPTQYNLLVNELRPRLDAAGFTNVGIVGPGLASMSSWSNPAGYIGALDDDGVAGLAAWSTHAWGADACGGGPCIEDTWPSFGDHADSRDPTKPKFVTEYATHETTFHGVTYPHCDRYGTWDETKVFPYYSVSNTMPYAARVYEDTLGLLNSGAHAPFIWQAIDEPTEVNPPGYTGTKHKSWGLLDLWGNPKPVYGALETLYPKIPVGADVIVPPDQSPNYLYAGAFREDDCIIIGVANDGAAEQQGTICLTNAPVGLEVLDAVAFVQIHWGDPDTGDPDVGQAVDRDLTLVPGAPGEYTLEVALPADSTLTIVCDVTVLIGDVDGDGDVDLSDLAALLASYNACAGDPDFNPAADLDGSGCVDLSDLAALLADYGSGR